MINVITPRRPAAKWPSLHHTTNEFIQHVKNSSKSRTLKQETMRAEIDLLFTLRKYYVWFKCLLIWVKQIKLMFICSMKSKLFSSWSRFNNIFLLTFIVNIWAIYCCQRNPENNCFLLERFSLFICISSI